MKVTVDLECTPEEARRFMGLPDLSPLHDAYIERFRTSIEQGLTPDSMQKMVQTWGPMGEAGLALWKQMLDRIGTR
jgi:hypothetical protein